MDMARLQWRHSFWDGKRKPFVISICMAGLMLILLFLGVLSYLYGSLFKSEYRIHNLNILAVDYDGGIIGESMLGAYQRLKGDSFPTLQVHSAEEYPTIESVRKAVCKGHFWGAIVSQPGATDRLSAALTGSATATTYNSSDTLTYVWNAAYYPTIQLGDISGNLETLIGASTAVYHALNGTGAISTMNTSSPEAVLAYSNPISSSNINIMPTNQGSKVLYNTVTMVLPMIQQFFFLMALNGISNNFNIYGRLRGHNIGLMRLAISFVYTFLASLTVAGYIWAYREGWGLSGNKFGLLWMTFWFYMHINFGILDAVTAFIPASFLSFFVLTWVILNITSTIYPFELSPDFYRWAYALPAHEIYTIQLQIYGGGCNNRLHIALPVLFCIWIIASVLSILGSIYRNKNAERELLALEERERSLIEEGKRVGLKTRGELQRAAADTFMAGFPMPFQRIVRTIPMEDEHYELRRQGTV